MDIDLDAVPNAEALKQMGEMTLFELSNPELIHQGTAQTCNAAVLQKQLAINEPHRYAQIAKDISCYDTFVTADGTTIKPSSLGAFTLDHEGQVYANRRANWSVDEDLHREHFSKTHGKEHADCHYQFTLEQCRARDLRFRDRKKVWWWLHQIPLVRTPESLRQVRWLSFGTDGDNQLCYKQGDQWKPFLTEKPGLQNQSGELRAVSQLQQSACRK